MYYSYEFFARSSREERLALLAYVTAPEKRFYYRGACGRASYAVFLECVAQRFVVYVLSGRFHGAQERCFGKRFGRLGELLCYRGLVRAAFAFDEVRQNYFGFFVPLLVVCLLVLLREYSAPCGLDNLFSVCLEFYVSAVACYCGCRKTAVGIKHGYEVSCHEVEHVSFVNS